MNTIQSEGQNIEFKSNWSDDVLKTICAFANTEGGLLYIGIDDKGRPVDLKDINKLLETIPNKVKDILGIVCDLKIIKKRNKPIIKIAVKKYTAPISYKGAFYIRSGSTTLELKGMELSRFLLSKAGTTWDNIIEPKAKLDDLDLKTIKHFQQLAKGRFPYIAKEKNIKLILQKLNLIEKGKLKRACILLFGKDPRKFFNSAYIQIGRFISESEVISTDIIEGNLFEQVERTIEVLRLKYLENRFYYEGIHRREDLIYPEEALREAIINAVIHRDYLGPHTQLRVYDNKLWLWNAGKLPPEITLEKLKKPHSSYPRNELLADVFFKAGFIEAWGRGTLKIIEKCKEKNLPEPEFSELTGGFLVSFYKPKEAAEEGIVKKVTARVTRKVTTRVTRNQEIILERIRKNPYITIKELAEIVKISERKIKENIKRLKQKKMIKRIGPKKGGFWKVI